MASNGGAETEPAKASFTAVPRRSSAPDREEPVVGLDGEGIATSAKGPVKKSNDGNFAGSFGGTARKITHCFVDPWYQRPEYFTHGWTDSAIWRAAVSITSSIAPRKRGTIGTNRQLMLGGHRGHSDGHEHLRPRADWGNHHELRHKANCRVRWYIQHSTHIGVHLRSIPRVGRTYESADHMDDDGLWLMPGCQRYRLVVFARFWWHARCLPARTGVLYLIFQTIGAAVGGALLRASWGYERAVKSVHLSHLSYFSLCEVWLTTLHYYQHHGRRVFLHSGGRLDRSISRTGLRY
jgi:hypothetical protein